MITYRPIAPLTVGSGTLRSVLAAMAAAAFLGTAAFGAEAAQAGPRCGHDGPCHGRGVRHRL